MCIFTRDTPLFPEHASSFNLSKPCCLEAQSPLQSGRRASNCFFHTVAAAVSTAEICS
jgi:hypothetical protein